MDVHGSTIARSVNAGGVFLVAACRLMLLVVELSLWSFPWDVSKAELQFA